MKPPTLFNRTIGIIAAGILAGALGACQRAVSEVEPPKREVAAVPVENSEPALADPEISTPPLDSPLSSQAILPCLPEEKPKTSRKRKPQAQPVLAAAEPAPQIPVPGAGSVLVKPSAVSVLSILGKKVQGENGDDFGRVVDVLSDSTGRVRIAIIEFGGFLGVGNRRIAVDWSLLKFRPEGQGAPVVLRVNRRQLQDTPDYKDSLHPQALMAPPTAYVLKVARPDASAG